MDGQTEFSSLDRVCIAQRGKNQVSMRVHWAYFILLFLFLFFYYAQRLYG